MAREQHQVRLEDLDLKRAIRILRHAGRPDPMSVAGNLESCLQALIDDLCELSIHDGLTGLVNARFFRAVLEREIDRSSRTGRACALLLIDLDHFKKVNDTHGHAAGDLVIQETARRLRLNLRLMDTAARIGGEEFAVILPECTTEDAVRAASRIHSAISPLQVDFGTITLEVTASAGLVWTDPHSIVSAATLLALADRELYEAKNNGRHRLCHPEVVPTEVSLDEREALEFGMREGGGDGS